MAIENPPAKVTPPPAPDRNTQQGNEFSNAARTWSFALPSVGDYYEAVSDNVFNNANEAQSFAQNSSASANSSAISASSASSSASSAQTSLSNVQSVIALAETIPFTLTSGDDFDSLSKVWPLIRTAFETNSLPWKPVVNLDFARDNYEEYVGLSAGATRAPLLDLAAFSRASSGTGVNAFGNIETVGANQPRIVFENGVAKGILLENTATNAATWSETDGTNYPIGNSGDWAGNLQTVGEITLDDQTAAPVISKDFASTNPSACASIFFYDDGTKNAASNKQIFRLECRGDVNAVASLFFDYATKSFSITAIPSYITYDVEVIGGGLYRIFLKCESSTVTNITAYRVATYSDTTYRSTLGGLQVELGTATPSSYIKTEGTSVVRTADDFSYTLPSGFSSSGDWTLFAEITPLNSNFGDLDRFFTITDGTSSNRITLRCNGALSGNFALLSVANGVLVNGGTATFAPISGDKFKCALKKNGASYDIYINGSLASSLTNSQTFSASLLYLGQGQPTSTNTNCQFSKLEIFPTALSDVVCQAITGV